MLRTSLSRRVIAFVLLPLTFLFAASLFWVERSVRQNTTVQMRGDLVKQQRRLQQEQIIQGRQTQRTLQVLGENAALKAALTLHRDLENSGSLRDPTLRSQLRHTLEERLQSVRDTIEADSLTLVGAPGQTLAHWQRSVSAIYTQRVIPINLGPENLGRLVVGNEFHLASFASGAEAILIQNGRVEQSTLPISLFANLSRDWSQAGELQLGHEQFIAVPINIAELGPQYAIVMLASVDAAVAPFLHTLRTVLFPATAVSLALALVLVWFASRAVTQPLQSLTRACQDSIQKGILEIPPTSRSGVLEVNVLADSLHRAAIAASDARYNLQQAYLQILEALVESLEARDPYTAGHSRRVSDYSIWIGRQLALPAQEIESLRIGALLHDIGKIGIPDAVLLKDGRLTDDEFRMIKMHPGIGVRILERIGAFEPYLGVVGLHHENQDGSGYPHGLRGEQIPLAARIVHLADAYDAMTSNRPYRNRMPEDKVRRILRECSGTQFDPSVVEAFFASPANSMAANLELLHAAINDRPSLHRADPDLPMSVDRPGISIRL